MTMTVATSAALKDGNSLIAAQAAEEVPAGSIPCRSRSPPPSPVGGRRSFGLVRFQPPEASLTQRAVDGFFSCSGKMFHVFSKDQIAQCSRGFFDAPSSPVETAKADLGCLMAVAAVGAQYASGVFSRDAEDGFYDIARHYLEAVVEYRPLYAIKVCALLALYNILTRATISLGYVEFGLGMARREGLSSGASRPVAMSDSDWLDYRKTWRTLTFFSNWLCSTLGFIPGYDIVCEGVPLGRAGDDDDDDSAISEVVQTEMSKICQLKADILRMHLAVRDLTIPAMKSISKDLQSWYESLPRSMRLEAVGRDGLAVETKRSILHVHLLYLGAIMLLYRRIAPQYMRSLSVDKDCDVWQTPVEDVVAERSADALFAAGTSARILKLLFEDNGIFKRCWLVTFQAYTSCLILLHAVGQKQLHNFECSTWTEDMERAQDCLAVLAFCGSVDRVASQFHDRLTAISEELLARQRDLHPSSPPPHRMDTDGTRPGQILAASGDTAFGGVPRTAVPSHHYFLLTLPEHVDPSRIYLCISLLVMLCQPFGDLANKASAEPNIKELAMRQNDPTGYKYLQMIQRLKWDFGSNIPFQWDFGQLDPPFAESTSTGVPSGGAASIVLEQAVAEGNWAWNQFLGSDQPSGWR